MNMDPHDDKDNDHVSTKDYLNSTLCTLEPYEDKDDEEDIALKNIIVSAINAPPPQDMSDPVHQLDQLWHYPHNFGSLGSTIEDTIIHTASCTAFDSPAQDALIDLILAVRAFPPRQGRDCWNDIFSGGLPGNLHEAYEGGQDLGCHMNWNDRARERETKRWRNFNAFDARLTAARLVDSSLHGMWSLRDALENPLDPYRRPKSRKARNGAIYRLRGPPDLMVCVAADWIEVAGLVLFERGEDMIGQSAMGGTLWKGDEGWGIERWEFWKERFDVLSRDETLAPETNDLCSKAAELISGYFVRGSSPSGQRP